MIKTDPKTGLPKRTIPQARALYRYRKAITALERSIHNAMNCRYDVPMGWEEIAKEYSCRKTRVTIRLDEDVVKFFKSMGPRYQTNINEALQMFVQAKLAGIFQTIEEEIALHDEVVAGERSAAQQRGQLTSFEAGEEIDWDAPER